MRLNDPALSAPTTLATDAFTLRPIALDDAQRDYEAVMATRDDLLLWEQSDWPAPDFTVDANRADLEGMAERTTAGSAHDYIILAPTGNESLGCVYIFPTTAGFLYRSSVEPLGTLKWNHVDAVVYFWARAPYAQDGLTQRLLDELRKWFRDEWNLSTVVFAVSSVLEHQMAVLEASDLTPQFTLREPEKPAPYVLFG